MYNKVNYIDEIRKIESAIDHIDETPKARENAGVRSRLSVMLDNLEKAAEEMALYISEGMDESYIDYLRQSNDSNLQNNNYSEYLSGLTKLLRTERISLICATQTPDEKAYFLKEYAKYKKEHVETDIPKVR